MKRKLGTVLIALGTALVLAALVLWGINRQASVHAQQMVRQVLPQVVEKIQTRRQNDPLPNPYYDLLPVEQIDGYGYIGYLTVPALGVEQPVLAEMDAERLQIAPCRYSGTHGDRGLVIGAHNYAHNFGKLSQLQIGDTVTFVDMDGRTYDYQVSEVEILPPTAVAEMVSDAYDLTLFTCTFGGAERIAVRCDLAQ